jgi:hypothetical protein
MTPAPKLPHQKATAVALADPKASGANATTAKRMAAEMFATGPS